jgi:hypothetical protein
VQGPGFNPQHHQKKGREGGREGKTSIFGQVIIKNIYLFKEMFN